MQISKYQNAKNLLNLSNGWVLKQFDELLKDVTRTGTKIPSSNYEEVGQYPVIDQGKELIAGYSNLENPIEGDKIIFGDHTRVLKYIDFDSFHIGADGVKVLENKMPEKVSTKYIYYYLTSIEIPNTGYNRHFKYLKEIVIPVPSFEIQLKLVELFDHVKSLMSKRQSQIGALDELMQSVFLEMFGDPVVNHKKLPKKKLGETGELKRGMSKHRPRNAPELLGGPYPLIQTGDVSRAGLFIEDFTSTYSELGLQQSKMWETGTLCITIAANIAETSILKFDACFPDSVVGYKPFNNMNTIFVHYWFSFFQKILEASAPESAQKNINLKILNNIEIITPSIEQQNEFANKVMVIFEQKKKMEGAKSHMEDLYNSLLQKAFKGELFQN